jgi:hypothetical protein
VTKFEDLPDNIQALLLAKLGMAASANRCATLHELARRKRTDLTGAWRSICRAAGQPPCTVPLDAVNAPRSIDG